MHAAASFLRLSTAIFTFQARYEPNSIYSQNSNENEWGAATLAEYFELSSEALGRTAQLGECDSVQLAVVYADFGG